MIIKSVIVNNSVYATNGELEDQGSIPRKIIELIGTGIDDHFEKHTGYYSDLPFINGNLFINVVAEEDDTMYINTSAWNKDPKGRIRIMSDIITSNKMDGGTYTNDHIATLSSVRNGVMISYNNPNGKVEVAYGLTHDLDRRVSDFDFEDCSMDDERVHVQCGHKGLISLYRRSSIVEAIRNALFAVDTTVDTEGSSINKSLVFNKTARDELFKWAIDNNIESTQLDMWDGYSASDGEDGKPELFGVDLACKVASMANTITTCDACVFKQYDSGHDVCCIRTYMIAQGFTNEERLIQMRDMEIDKEVVRKYNIQVI